MGAGGGGGEEDVRRLFCVLEIMTGDFFVVRNFPVDSSCFWDFFTSRSGFVLFASSR